jgi:hypothetical protein
MSLGPTSTQHTSIAGEFAVLSQLALRGYDANLTVGRAKSVDILVSRPGGEMYRLEVKTNWRSKTSGGKAAVLFGQCVSEWMMGEKHEKIIDPRLFYCFLNISGDGASFRFFVVPSAVVAEYVRVQHQVWLDADSDHSRTNTIRTFRIGSKGQCYPFATPTAEDWENNWEFRQFPAT